MLTTPPAGTNQPVTGSRGSASEERAAVRDELTAALAARRELGEELEPQLIDGFVERIERRLEQRAAQPPAPSRDRGNELALAIVSMLFAIPMLAIAGGTAGLLGVVAVCAALVLVNASFRR